MNGNHSYQAPPRLSEPKPLVQLQEFLPTNVHSYVESKREEFMHISISSILLYGNSRKDDRSEDHISHGQGVGDKKLFLNIKEEGHQSWM